MKKKIFYKGVEVNSFGVPVFLVPKDISIPEGRTKRVFHNTFLSDIDKDSAKDLIVMYDIPHEKKKERDWFRRHLKKFNYVMVQKSVWVGPSPLPKDFLVYVKSIGLKDLLKTFKLAKPYTGKGDSI